MPVIAIAVRNIKTVLFNKLLVLLIVIMPVLQMFIMSTVIESAEVPQNGTVASGFTEIILLGQTGGASLIRFFAASTLVQFLMMTGIIAAAMVIGEKEKHTLARVFSTPLKKRQIIAGNLLGHLVTTLTVALAVLVLAKLLLGIDWGNSLIDILVVTVFVVCTITALGFVFSGLFRNMKLAVGVMSFTIMAMTFLSGGFTSGDQFSVTSRFTLNKWAFDAYIGLMEGKNLWDIKFNLAVLAVISIVLGIAACILYRRENVYE